MLAKKKMKKVQLHVQLTLVVTASNALSAKKLGLRLKGSAIL